VRRLYLYAVAGAVVASYFVLILVQFITLYFGVGRP
jgi:ABC-type multidrug transport system permease subunit